MIDRPAEQKHGIFHSSANLQCNMLPFNSAVTKTQAIPPPTFQDLQLSIRNTEPMLRFYQILKEKRALPQHHKIVGIGKCTCPVGIKPTSSKSSSHSDIKEISHNLWKHNFPYH